MSTGLSIIPRQAVIVTAGGDSGQTEIARALEEPLENEFGKKVIRIDINDFLSETTGSTIKQTYRKVLDTMPRVLAGILGGDQNEEIEKTIQEIRTRIDTQTLVNVLGGSGHPNGPSAVFCLHPIAAAAIGELRRRGNALYPIWGVLGDFYVNPLWIQSAIDRYAVAHSSLVESFQKVGLSEKQIYPTGIPVKELVPDKTQKESCKSLGLDPDLPVLLILAKGQDEERLDRILFQLSLVNRPASFLFGTGSDQRASKILRERAPRYGVRAKMFGETSSLGPILDTSNIVIAPARGSVVARALCRGIPLFAISPEGKEAQNIDFLTKHQAGVRVDNVLQLAAELDIWLSQNAIEEKIRELAMPDAPKNLAKEGLKSAKEVDKILAEAKKREEHFAKENLVQTPSVKAPEIQNPETPGFFEEIGDPPSTFQNTDNSSGRQNTKEALAAVIYSERQAIAKEEESKAAAARWERRREMALRRGEAELAAEAAIQADRARAEIARARKERESAAQKRASLSLRNQPEQRFEELEQRAKTAEKNWRSLELDDELDELKRRMKPKKTEEDSGPAR